MKERRELLSSHQALIQRDIVPHIRGGRKNNSHANTISLCTQHRLEKQQPCITDPEQRQGGGRMSDNADAPR